MMMMIIFTLKRLQRGCHKSNPPQKCRPANGISKRVTIQITKDTDTTSHSSILVVFSNFFPIFFLLSQPLSQSVRSFFLFGF
jgi:hypothetical protein